MEPDAYCIHKRFEVSPASEFQMDRHYLLYVREGSVRLEADGQRWTLPPARAALICAGHTINITVLTNVVSSSILFSKQFLPLPAHTLSVFDLSPLARELIAECRDWGPETGPLSTYARQIFETLGSVAYQLAQQPSPCVLPAPSSLALKKALDLTEKMSGNTVRFDEIARIAGQSPRALSRRFADELGMTWSEALRRIRIVHAIEALAGSQTSVTQIAMDVGYNSVSAFNAAFRDLMGKSPTEYRASFNN